MTRGRIAAAALVLALGVLLAGCGTLGYYGQSVSGHLDLMSRRTPIVDVIADPATSEPLRERLTEALAVREFAVEALALPDGGSYRSFVQLERPYVVWNVVAAPEFSLVPRTWCFPVAGCVAYRGYFDEAAAHAFAAETAAEGLEVHVGGVRAYSTLGWFDDPLLSTMLEGRPRYAAGVIFHELAHQRVYVSGDSSFNEAYAVVVEREGMRRWLRAAGRAGEVADYERSLARRGAFLQLVLDARERLGAVYESGAGPAAMRERKAEIVAALRESLAGLAAEWGAAGVLDGWAHGTVNNARLALVATYHERVPAFERLLESVDGNLGAFHQAVEALAGLPDDERRAALVSVADSGA